MKAWPNASPSLVAQPAVASATIPLRMDQNPEGAYAHVDQPAFEQTQIDHNISRIAIFFVCFLTVGVFYFTLVNFPVAKMLPIQQIQQFGQLVNSLNPATRSAGASSHPSGALGGSLISASPSASASGAPAASSAAAAPAASTPPSAASSATANSAPGSASASSPGVAPAGGTYRVRAGDTLSSIARRYGTSVQAIAQANKIGNSSTLQVGQRLTIPSH